MSYRKMTIIFLYFLCKMFPLQHISLKTQSIPMDPKYSVIKGLHCMLLYTVAINFCVIFPECFA